MQQGACLLVWLSGLVQLLPWALLRASEEGPGGAPAAGRMAGQLATCPLIQPCGPLADPPAQGRPEGFRGQQARSRSPLHVHLAEGQGHAWPTQPVPVQAPLNQTSRPTGRGRTVKRSCLPSTAHTELHSRIHREDKPPLGDKLPKDVSR